LLFVDAAVKKLNSTADSQFDDEPEDNPNYKEPEYNNVTTKNRAGNLS